MEGTGIDFNIDNYSNNELLKLFSLKDDESLTQNKIIIVTNHHIQNAKNDNSQNMVEFFQSAQGKLIRYLDKDDTESDTDDSHDNDNNDDDNTSDGSDDDVSEEDDTEPTYGDKAIKGEFQSNVITNMEIVDPEFGKFIQPAHLAPTTKVQADKITDRVGATEILGMNDHFIQKRKNLGVSDIMQVPITQGILNPNLKNKITRIINIDSQYRQNINMNAEGNPSDFTIDLAEPINDVIGMRLFSIQVPYTWYLVDNAYGTDFLCINDINTKVYIDEGNYTLPQLVDELNDKLYQYDISANLNIKNGKTTLTSKSMINTICFYDPEIPSSSHLDNNLGYILGFRQPIYYNNNSQVEWSITSEAVGDTYGTKYFLVHLDDFNSNQMNSNIIGASDNSETHLRYPFYFGRDVPTIPTGTGTTDFFVVPREKKDLTIAQLYNINEINKNRTKEVLRNTPPTMNNMFGMIPIKRGDFLGPAFCENGGSLQSCERTYFGPVNIQRLHVKLIDDKGNTVNLNGCNWSFSIVCETLYQY